MKKLIKLMVLFVFCTQIASSQDKINVLEKIKANKIPDQYYVLETDSVIHFKGKRYLIEFREFFNENQFDKIAIWKPLGYLEFSNVEIAKSRKFMQLYNIKPIIQASITDAYHININGKAFLIISRNVKLKEIYYFDRKFPKELYILKYK
ncbi:hypothetical protein SRABI27_04862 [Pedobacter sp. Bi27]|uniref:hypothetical protein n=1 Tax=unclassified Pedobacter TaxID=2628915 RepID=UPI001DA1B4DE|nr:MULTISPECIES: hypothetical protein [unclassified Pedobacter]CAH0304293.1 hypothetical protein SRABI36_04753 [Pedobacter sp. Bi36]CAH0312881.1 hypothetical protein SRABI27_04862 [Pedobacter sp. Bi27]CAH0313442.1 hypothetical protein SRABI126_04877 [Pedobacter sp. Bi126]